MLRALGFDAERSNERSALVLLALLGLRPGEHWKNATNATHGVTPIMEHVRAWGTSWAPNTRETVRRQTLHQFVDAGLVEYNHDRPDRPVNSPKANYRVSPAALSVIKQWGESTLEDALAAYLLALPGQVEAYRAAREMHRIPITLPDGSTVTLSPGGQNVLLADMVEEFCPRWTPGGRVLYLGDADSKLATFDEAQLSELGVTVDHHGKLPDLVVWMPDRNWLVLMEAASSHGPVDSKRHAELSAMFAEATPGLVFVSCFPSRAEMRKYLAALAWETEAWCADNPDHLIHFNGERFLGPY
ncbi:BsuBI/PstI family type II restriction endonuclease [Georgenia yuyongxinii]